MYTGVGPCNNCHFMTSLAVATERHLGNHRAWFLGVLISMMALSMLAVALRFTSRYIKQQPLWWDDWMVLFSLIWLVVTSVAGILMYKNGLGFHVEQVSPSSTVMVVKWLLVGEVLYAWNLCWTKISVLLMYNRIFRFGCFKRIAFGVGGVVIAWGITITFLSIFICTPVKKIWEPSLPGHCLDQVSVWIANAVSTICTDLAILLLPIREVWKLRLKLVDKIAVSLTFGMGSFVVCSSAYRFSVLFSYRPIDPTYTLTSTTAWTLIEISVGIVSACLPIMRPVAQLLTHNLGAQIVRSCSTHQPSEEISQSVEASQPQSSGDEV